MARKVNEIEKLLKQYEERKHVPTYKTLKEKYGIAICENHTGKMEGMHSLSTSCMHNPHCLAYMKLDGCICQGCFSCRMHKTYGSNFENRYLQNTEVLTTQIIPKEEWPVLNTMVFRIESFGDVQNTIQVQNYFNFCNQNPKVKFAVWTKNPWYYNTVINKMGIKKPKNLIMIYSSPFENIESTWMLDIYPFLDKVFTVYTKEYLMENVDILKTINCGGKVCLGCLLCYLDKKTVFIREIKK